MLNNLINQHDFVLLLNGLRTGSIWHRLKRLFLGRNYAVQEAWRSAECPPTSFVDIPAVRQRINALISGDPDLDYITYASQAYLSPFQPLRGLSLGCGNGHKTMQWAEHCCYTQMDAYDLSESRIAYARSTAQAAEHQEIHYQVADVYRVDWPETHYDVVFCEHSLHHFSPLDPLLMRIGRSLKPTGYLIVDEFVGPTRFQWSDRQLELINHTLGILPRRYKRRWQNGSIKEQVHRPSRLSMMIGDPSEAVESSRILPLLEQHFDVVERKNYGGTILAILLEDIALNFFSR